MTELADRPAEPTISPARAPEASPAPAAARTTGTKTGSPAVDVAALGEQLLGKWAAVRRQSRELAGRPELHKTEGRSSWTTVPCTVPSPPR